MARSRDRIAPEPIGFNLFDFVFRTEVIGTALVVAGLAAVPLLLPVLDLLADLRDSVLRLLGVHALTVVVLGVLGVALSMLRRYEWLVVRPRYVGGIIAMVVFSAGLLAFWTPNERIGGVDLHIVTAGGAFGRALLAWPGVLPWLASFFIGFALIWPETAAEIARTAPGAAARGTLAGLGWMWESVLVPGFWGVRDGIDRLRQPSEDWDDEEDRDGFDEDEDYEEGPFEDEEGDWDEEPEPAKPAARARAPWPEAKPSAPVAPRQAAMTIPEAEPVRDIVHSTDGWQLPPISLLEDPKAINKQKAADTQRRAALIVDTLASFGVDSRVVEINEGPTVTQFGVEPGWDVRTRTVQERDIDGPIYDDEGKPVMKEIEVSRTRIRVNRITSLQNDLALALAAPALRIEAPVPGKPVVGIEVPNTAATVVTMKQLMGGQAYEKFAAKADLPIALGAGVSGEPVLADLAKMPHLLIAGATGAGKSVCLNAIITGLLLRFSPNELRMVLIDPKRVEMTPYQEVPHLAFSHIVVDMDKVVGTLQAVINEMESRYRRFAQAGVKNLKTYNEQAAKIGGMKLPFWVVVVDELADLMLAAPYQVETQIVRLAQLARATGIHLVIATQRPSVDVVTGLIKANFPTRIAFAMSSQVDSRTVLDQGGAEKLLGRGDMLFVPPDAQKPRRVQGVYLSDAEIEAVVDFWTSDRFAELAPEKHDDLLEAAEEEIAEETEAKNADPLLNDAIEVAREAKTMSISMLQRRLKVGYPRAARIMDALEERGVVAAAQDGTNSREVLHDDVLNDDHEEAARTGVVEAGDSGSREAPAVFEDYLDEARALRAAEDMVKLAAARDESRRSRRRDEDDIDSDDDEAVARESRDRGPRKRGPSGTRPSGRRRVY